MKKYIFISLILTALFSCTKTINFDDEGLADQLVLNSIIWPDSAFSASLNKSSSILTDRRIGQMTSGTLDLYENGTLLTQITSPMGQFRAKDIKPKVGSTYRIVVNSNGKQVEAETTIPNPVKVISLDTTTIRDKNNSKRLNFTVKIKDQEGDDYYRITTTSEILTLIINSDGKGSRKYYLQKNQNSINSDDPVFNSLYNNFGGKTIDMGPSNEYNIFPDNYFQGKEYSIQFQISNSGYGNISYNSGYGGGKRIYERNVIHIQKLSKDLYNYLKYLELYNFYHDDPFSEPVPVYSNIKNGVGIFAGFNDDARFTFEKIYIPFSMDTIKLEENNGYGGYGGY
jgi:hypothetical protein